MIRLSLVYYLIRIVCRLWMGVQAPMWGAFEAEPVLEGVRDVLLALQLRAAGDVR